MMSPLNRIERDYILESFRNDSPEISIVHPNGILKLTNSQYCIKESTIYFAKHNNKLQGNIKVLFMHKERPLYFYAIIKSQEALYFFTFSDKLYKYDISDAPKEAIINFTSFSGEKFSAELSKEIPICATSQEFLSITQSEKANLFFFTKQIICNA